MSDPRHLHPSFRGRRATCPSPPLKVRHPAISTPPGPNLRAPLNGNVFCEQEPLHTQPLYIGGAGDIIHMAGIVGYFRVGGNGGEVGRLREPPYFRRFQLLPHFIPTLFKPWRP
uniref:Uncharacterized protein n=1 Tax=Bursaphelenchus xylophilus TaxID=6326 RepID=A0A1I7RXC8_BURXY